MNAIATPLIPPPLIDWKTPTDELASRIARFEERYRENVRATRNEQNINWRAVHFGLLPGHINQYLSAGTVGLRLAGSWDDWDDQYSWTEHKSPFKAIHCVQIVGVAGRNARVEIRERLGRDVRFVPMSSPQGTRAAGTLVSFSDVNDWTRSRHPDSDLESPADTVVTDAHERYQYMFRALHEARTGGCPTSGTHLRYLCTCVTPYAPKVDEPPVYVHNGGYEYDEYDEDD